MVPGDKAGLPAVDRAEKSTGTEIAVLPPEVVRLHRLHDLLEEGAFLGMAIFTGKDSADQAIPGLIHDEGFARQRAGLHLAQHFEAALTGGKTVPIENFAPIPRDPGDARAMELGEQRPERRRTLAHQRCRGLCLDPMEFVIDGDQGGADGVRLVAIRCPD